MKIRSALRLFLFPAFLFAAEKSSEHCGCSCCEGKPVCCCFTEVSADNTKSSDNETAVVRHPLRGVIVDIRSAQSALLVKHEAIPGYMRAMTMLFKADPAALTSLKKGQAITATLVERDDGFHLEHIKPVAN